MSAVSMGPHPRSKEAECEADTSLGAECFKHHPAIIGHKSSSAGSKCWETVDVMTKFGTSRSTKLASDTRIGLLSLIKGV